MKEEHLFIFLETSTIYFNNKKYEVDKYICKKCKGLYCVDRKTKKRISFHGGIGEECE